MKIEYLSLLSSLATSLMVAVPNAAYGESAIASEKTFFCQDNATVPTTLAKTTNGENVTIFNWHSDAFSPNANLQEICHDVSEKLENYLASEQNLSFGNFTTTEMDNIPAICLSNAGNSCDLVLFTMEPKTEAIASANFVLDSILNPQLKEKKVASSERCIKSTTYKVGLGELLDLNLVETKIK